MTAQAGAENFIFDTTYSDSTISGSDGLTITGFDQSNDKVANSCFTIPVGYDLDDFKLAAGIDIRSSAWTIILLFILHQMQMVNQHL